VWTYLCGSEGEAECEHGGGDAAGDLGGTVALFAERMTDGDVPLDSEAEHEGR